MKILIQTTWSDGAIHFMDARGALHREDGPAIIDYVDDGTIEWFKDDERHRAKGPAVIFDGDTEYWIDGMEAEPSSTKVPI